MVTMYTETPPTYAAALWDGTDPGPVDAMMVELCGEEYLGLTMDGTTLMLSGQGNLLFPGAGYTMGVPEGHMLVRGPFFGSSAGAAVWQMFPAAEFEQRFPVVG